MVPALSPWFRLWPVGRPRGLFESEPATRTYVVTGIHHEQLKVSEPYPVDIDLTETHARG